MQPDQKQAKMAAKKSKTTMSLAEFQLTVVVPSSKQQQQETATMAATAAAPSPTTSSSTTTAVHGSAETSKMQERKLVTLGWTQQGVEFKQESRVKQLVLDHLFVSHEWGPMELDVTLMQSLKSDTSLYMTLEQVGSFRQWILNEQAMHRHQRLQNQSHYLAQLYNNGYTLADIVNKCQAPPLAVFRLLLESYHGMNKSLAKAALAQPAIHLSIDDQQELQWAIAHDSVTMIDQTQMQQRAKEFEHAVSDRLKKHAVVFNTEAELKQAEESATPDYVFCPPLDLGIGMSIAWIDAKRFYGTGQCPMLAKKLKKQAAAFVKRWGSGAMLFRLGFSDALDLGPGVFKLALPKE